MKILIIFYSHSGNTKKVTEMLKERLEGKHEVLVKNALTFKPDDLLNKDLVLIGSPIFGKILFGQKFCKEIINVIENVLPKDLNKQKVIIFATYLFWPRKALQNYARKLEQNNNAKVVGLASKRRSEKENLVKEIIDLINIL